MRIKKGRGRKGNSKQQIYKDKTRDEEKRKDRLTVFSNKEDVDYFTSNSFHFMVDALFAPYPCSDLSAEVRGWPVSYQNHYYYYM